MPVEFTSQTTGRTFGIGELEQPRLFLWQLASYADDLQLGSIDSYEHEPGVWQEGREQARWHAWMRYDRRGALPAEFTPERFYLATGLRSLSKIGDYSGSYDLPVKVVSQRFLTTLQEAGQPDMQIMPLTVWRRAQGDHAPQADAVAEFFALYCWADPKVFDLELSSLDRIDLDKYGSALTDDGLDAPSVSKVYTNTWQNMALSVPTGEVDLPPLFRISGAGGGRYVSPQFAATIERRKLKVNLVKRSIDPDRESAIGEAVRQGMLTAWPPEHPLGD